MNKRLLTIGIWTAAALAIIGQGCGCKSNQDGFLLTPTGELPVPATGSVSGRLAFGGGTFDQSLILMARVRDPNCTSAYTTITVTGTNTDPIFNVATSPSLTQLAPCVWVDTLTLASARIGSELFRWKFVTNNAFDTPPDYSTADAALVDGLENILAFAGPGSPDLDAEVPAGFRDAPIVCTLDETTDPPSYRFETFDSAPAAFSSTVDGSFAVTNLVPGTYKLRVRPPTGAPVDMTVEVGNVNTDLGTIQVGAPAGSISGELEFDPTLFPDLANPPWPPVAVRLYRGAIQVDQVMTTRTDKTFSFTDLPAADYVVKADANFYAPDSAMATVSVGNVDAGTLTLNFDFNELPSAMHLTGDFNGFAIVDSTQMALNAQLVWQLTPNSPIAPGTYFMKFVRNGSPNNPSDYGGDESVTIPVPVVQEPTQLVTGFGTAIKIQISTGSIFKFTLDERRQTFSIEAVPAPRTVAERTKP